MAKRTPSKEAVKVVLDEVQALGLSDGAHWAMVHQRLRLPYGDVFPIMTADPEFFGLTKRESKTHAP
jgi:hypothetical protein